MDVFKVFTVENITEGFLAITSYAYRYFESPNIMPMEFWSKMLDHDKDNTLWNTVLESDHSKNHYFNQWAFLYE